MVETYFSRATVRKALSRLTLAIAYRPTATSESRNDGCRGRTPKNVGSCEVRAPLFLAFIKAVVTKVLKKKRSPSSSGLLDIETGSEVRIPRNCWMAATRFGSGFHTSSDAGGFVGGDDDELLKAIFFLRGFAAADRRCVLAVSSRNSRDCTSRYPLHCVLPLLHCVHRG